MFRRKLPAFAIQAGRVSSILLLMLTFAAWAQAQVNVTTQHGDNARTGANTGETALKPATLSSSTFGKLFSHAVDGFVYAQPLVLTNVAITGKGTHNLVIIATEHNSVYAFDADDANGANANPLWQVNFGPSVPNGDVGTDDVQPEIGITGTPVIDPVSKTLYVVAKTKESGVYFQRLHALNLANGSDRVPPVVIQGQVAGTGDGSLNGILAFNPLRHMQRPGLLLLNGKVYIGFSAHGDVIPYHGWIFAYNASNLQLAGVYCTSPNGKTDPSGYPLGGGGIWMSGGGLAADTSGNLYFSTGNGTFDANTGGSDYGDSFLKLRTSPNFSVADYFTPFNQDDLNRADNDLGSGGLIVLPDSVGSPSHPHLLIGAGKEGKIYLLNRDNMGHFHAGDDSQIVSLGGQTVPYQISGTWSKPAYWNGRIYFQGDGDFLKAFTISSGVLSSTAVSQSIAQFDYPGATPTISANGAANGIAWVIQPAAQAVLHAYDAANLSTELYSSDRTDGRDTTGGYVKFTVPTVANGKVYIGTQYGMTAFGAGQWCATPVITPPGGNFYPSVTVTITDATPGAVIHYTTDGSDPTTASPVYSAPLTIANCLPLKARAFATGYNASAIATASFIIDQGQGDGDGLKAEYYNDAGNGVFFASPVVTRVDPTVNFTDSGQSPAPGVAATNWSARWTGWLQPRCSGTYTIGTLSDDGVRVWVNNQLIIDNWTYHDATLNTGTITLTAGQKYPIKVEYFQYCCDSVMQLFWSVQGGALDVIPQAQLYSGGPLTARRPLILPRTGTFNPSVTVTFQTNTTGADLRYTLDGSEPSGASPLYTGPLTLTQTAQVKVRAFKNGLTASATAFEAFTRNANTPIYQINSGGNAAPPFSADAFFSDGEGHSRVGEVDKSLTTNPAPQAVYEAERFSNSFGEFSYTLPNLTPNAAYLLRLHYEDSDFTLPGQRLFHLTLNGQDYLKGFDIIADAGNPFTAVVKEFIVQADGNGRITLNVTSVVNVAKISGIEVIPATLPTPLAPGNGDGLSATYYPSLNFSGPPVQRVDPQVNFNWGFGSPDPAIPDDFFCARWTGLVQPRYTGQYTFQTLSEDGVRVWVDNRLVVDNWTRHGDTWNSGAIALNAGQKYPIRVEYFQYNYAAIMQLYWASLAEPLQLIPQSQLYSNQPAISGVITLQQCVDSMQPLTFTFHPVDGSSAFTRAMTLNADGSFSIAGVPAGAYMVAIKGAKWLQKDLNVDTTNGAVTNIAATLLAGDINGDNFIDIDDLGLLAFSYGTQSTDPNWNANADLTCDGYVDIDDLGLLAYNYGKQGDP